MIKIVEVGPRDGLQNESRIVPADVKVDFINALSGSGVSEIEVSSFVSPKMIPQLKDAGFVFEKITRRKNCIYSALVPNERGFDKALDAGVDKISLFTAASETFNRKNIHTTIEGSLERFRPVISRALEQGLPIRVYISTALWCAFEGRIPPEKVLKLALRLIDMGVDELSISDTIGKATPDEVAQLLEILLSSVPKEMIAVHFHDTYGNGIENVLTSASFGIRTFDASAGGLGGCPFAPGATGNVSTEAVVIALEKAGFQTDVDIAQLIQAGNLLTPHLGAGTPRMPEPDSLACSTCEFFDGKTCCGRFRTESDSQRAASK